MNTTHDTKDWQSMPQAPLQSPPTAVDPSSPKPTTTNTTFTASTNYNPYPQPESNSMQQQPSYQEVDTSRLPGMIAHSQPGTPRPENTSQQGSPIYQQPTPFPARTSVRGRTSLFANETGPYFSPVEPFENLYSSDKTTLLSVRVQSKMDRGFFMAENDWTCYRRNYFQVSSVFSIHGFNHYYSLNEPHQMQQIFVQGEQGMVPVHRFLLGITAHVANSEKEIELIQHTPKRDKGPQFRPDPKPITPGGNLTMSSVANNQNIVTFERVQFKTATANNGKRRAAQQYYVCVVELFADTDRHELIKVASCRSSPLVVRGRSPGHYADIGDRPVGPNTNAATVPTTAAGSGGAPVVQENQRQHVFSTYQKPSGPGVEYNGNQPGYPYYPPSAAAGYHQYNPAQHGAPNVSSPASHPPLPSPYAHHTQVPNYAIHDTTSHAEGYSNEFQNNNSNEETKAIQQHSFNMQQTGPMESPHSGYDWQRARYNSSSSSSSAPSPGQQTEGPPQQAYFSQNETRASYSPTTPTYANSGRKYNNNAVPNLMNKQIV
ncbi:hypothetical protein MFLAVUS_001748 [Mucor flavus]|uniref:NDT80 domain-containing protein n=1 Tax=Mucor flavus TaxID=439312 RepID=A0ABP9YNC7_9FUNG